MITLEVCCDSLRSALTAARCGAARIELCDNMAQGGTTPSAGNIKTVRANISIPVFVMVRPRGGDFVYTEGEYAVMKEDMRLCGEAGCDGIVTGCLHADGTVDVERTAELAALARSYGMETTFHRAFDTCRDLTQALEAVIAAGCHRILTSGGCETVVGGVETVRRLRAVAAGRLAVMPGSGVTPENAARIIRITGCDQIHGTFSSLCQGRAYHPRWAQFGCRLTDPQKVAQTAAVLSGLGGECL